jgi:hypothetical protein
VRKFLRVAGLLAVLTGVGLPARADGNDWMPWNRPDDRADPSEAKGGDTSGAKVRRPRREATVETRTEVRRHASLDRAPAGNSGGYSGGLGPRPVQWCGWYMRSLLGGGPDFNVAANWRRYGSPADAQVGAVVVWDHHVGLITGRAANGEWIVKSGNWSGRVHEGPRSISGATIRI